jgi:hypothetical protein
VKRTGNDRPPPCRGIIPPLKLAGANDMREHSGSEDAAKKQN